MWAIVRKDLLVEWRTKSGVVSLFVLGLLVLLIFAFAVPGEPTPELAAAALWLSFLLAGTLGAQRTFLLERDNLCLHGLLASPIDPGSIYLAKLLGTAATLGVLQAVVVPLAGLFFRVVPSRHPFGFLGVCLLGNVGFSAVVTLFAAISVQSKAREMLLPLLVFPLVVPLVIAGVKASAILLGPGSLGEASSWIQVLGAFAAMFVAAGWLLFEHVVRE